MAAPSWDALINPGRASDFFVDRPGDVFDPNDGARLVDAWWCAELSRLVYRDDGREDFLATTTLREVAFFADRGAEVILVGPRDAAAELFTIVVFRGTDELRDWLTNVRSWAVRWAPGGHVHHGFRRALTKVWRPLRRALRGAPGPVFAAGHSLGGAMALLAGSLLAARAVHTFGAPRTGDEGFAQCLRDVAILRFEHGRDLVPRLRIPGFVPVGASRHLGAPCDEGEVAPPQPEDRRWFDPSPPLADHAPIAYVRALRQLLDGNRAV